MAISDNLPARIAEWAGVGTTYYVDAAIGNDGNSETQAQSEATPWATIQKAIDTYVLPGTGHVRILVKNGTYRKPATSGAALATVMISALGGRSPTSTKVLHILNYPGHTPIVQEPGITGGTPGTSERHAFWFDDSTAKFIRVRGFEVTMNTPSCNQHQGFRIDTGSADLEIDDCIIHHWRSPAQGASPRSQGIYSEADRLHVYNCNTYSQGDAATEAAGASHSIYIASGTDNCVIVNCLAYDNRNGYGIQFFSGGSGGTGHIISHCVSANNLLSGIVVDGLFTADIRNCIFYDNDAYAVRCWGGATVTARYNLTNANSLAGNQGDGYEQSSGTLTVSNKVTSAPSFVDYASKNFHLNSGSPAYNAGLIEYTPTTDLDGDPRTVATLGAYAAPEEDPAPPPPPVVQQPETTVTWGELMREAKAKHHKRDGGTDTHRWIDG